jgi:hypothetical protein
MPQDWQRLWQMLPDRKQVGVSWSPSPPLILAAWDLPVLPKMMRLAEHIEWAASHGALEPIGAFLRGLQEDQWHHVGD